MHPRQRRHRGVARSAGGFVRASRRPVPAIGGGLTAASRQLGGGGPVWRSRGGARETGRGRSFRLARVVAAGPAVFCPGQTGGRQPVFRQGLRGTSRRTRPQARPRAGGGGGGRTHRARPGCTTWFHGPIRPSCRRRSDWRAAWPRRVGAKRRRRLTRGFRRLRVSTRARRFSSRGLGWGMAARPGNRVSRNCKTPRKPSRR